MERKNCPKTVNNHSISLYSEIFKAIISVCTLSYRYFDDCRDLSPFVGQAAVTRLVHRICSDIETLGYLDGKFVEPIERDRLKCQKSCVRRESRTGRPIAGSAHFIQRILSVAEICCRISWSWDKGFSEPFAPMDSNLFQREGMYCPRESDELLRCQFRPVQIPSLLAKEFAQELGGFTLPSNRTSRAWSLKSPRKHELSLPFP